MGPSDGTQANSIAGVHSRRAIANFDLHSSDLHMSQYLRPSPPLSYLSRLLSVRSSNSGSMEFTEESKASTPADSISASFQTDNSKSAESTWPDDWRAYVALLGGWLLMFNSWYVSQGSCPSLILTARWQGFGQRLRDLSIILSESSLARH